jgi:antitoxin (DNA-binding transcriptional repressor) of toxin-antitoxin stability system
MKTATFSQFRNNAKKFFDAVEKGETIEIYRYGKPVAMVSPVIRENNKDYWKGVSPVKIPGVSGSKYILDARKERRF